MEEPEQEQIPCGNEKKKSKGNGRTGNRDCTERHNNCKTGNRQQGRGRFLSLLLVLGSVVGFAQSSKSPVGGPAFSGTWKLDVAASKVQAAHPPAASMAWIQYDGKQWHYRRTHTYKDGKSETWSIELAVNSNLTHMEKDGPLTFFSKIHREGAELVLVEDIQADDGEKAKNTVRYRLLNGGKTLVELEHEETPKGNELNRWVFERQ